MDNRNFLRKARLAAGVALCSAIVAVIELLGRHHSAADYSIGVIYGIVSLVYSAVAIKRYNSLRNRQ